MKMGVVFPQTEFPPDPIAIRDYAQTVEELGFTHFVRSVGMCWGLTRNARAVGRAITHQHPFYEPLLVLFSYLAALTRRPSSSPAS